MTRSYWVALLSSTGCVGASLPTGTFACEQSGDCAPGFACIDGLCANGQAVAGTTSSASSGTTSGATTTAGATTAGTTTAGATTVGATTSGATTSGTATSHGTTAAGTTSGATSSGAATGTTGGTTSGAALIWTPVAAGQLLNIDWGQTTAPDMMVGPAAVGASANDQWNPAGVTFSMDYTTAPLVWADGSTSAVTAEATNLPGTWGFTAINGDLMMENYQYSWSGSTAQIELRGLPAGTYDLYFYCNDGVGSDGNSDPLPDNSGFGINVYEGEGGAPLSALAAIATNGTANPYQWTEGDQYVVQPSICVNAGNRVEVALANGLQGSGNDGIYLNGMQIVQTQAGACAVDGG